MQAGIQVTDVTGIEAGVRVVSGVAVGALKSVGSGVRYAILIISLPLLPVACGGGDEQPAATLSPPQAATSPTTNPTATFPPTSTETTSQTLVVMGGDEGRVDAPPVSVPGRVGRQEPPAHRRPPVRRSHGTGRRPRQGNDRRSLLSNGCDRMGARRWAPCLLRMPVQPNYGGRTTLCCQRRRFRPHTVVQPSGRKPCGVLQRRSPGSRLVP